MDLQRDRFFLLPSFDMPQLRRQIIEGRVKELGGRIVQNPNKATYCVHQFNLQKETFEFLVGKYAFHPDCKFTTCLEFIEFLKQDRSN